eukprot:352745-Chlamydomonas_euryale.AAC.8
MSAPSHSGLQTPANAQMLKPEALPSLLSATTTHASRCCAHTDEPRTGAREGAGALCGGRLALGVRVHRLPDAQRADLLYLFEAERWVGFEEWSKSGWDLDTFLEAKADVAKDLQERMAQATQHATVSAQAGRGKGDAEPAT